MFSCHGFLSPKIVIHLAPLCSLSSHLCLCQLFLKKEKAWISLCSSNKPIRMLCSLLCGEISPLTRGFPPFPFLVLDVLVNPGEPWWILPVGPECSTSFTEGGEPWSSSATSAPGRGAAEGRVSQGREAILGRGSPSSTELQDASRNRRAHPNWAILGKESVFMCLMTKDCSDKEE